eukprot:TRINITY_DN15422_c0_g1_i1.p1 TRINITY_DN15422_c0_g1~~TRINITY_DN15422_c0_g1_i1.p1  ORF type:complete len:1143 (+),score=45.55 TRINITY_DN15422_c0_g1_i1:152-3430(+)
MASGSICDVRCEPGYASRSPVACTLGEWSFSSGACEPMRCLLPPIIPNAIPMLFCQGMPSGGECQLRCHPGYNRAGSGLVCRLGEWNIGGVSCEPLSCDSAPHQIEVPHADLVALERCQGLATGGLCPLVCERGYEPSGHFICDLGQWVVAAARCVEDREKDADHTRKRLTSLVDPIKGISERVPRRLSTEFTSIGRGNGVVALPLESSMLQRPCMNPPYVRNSEDLSACAGLLSGDKCAVDCMVGHYKTGDLYCVDGSWLPAGAFVRCEAAPCRADDVFVSHAQPDNEHCEGTASGSSCIVQCEAGYSCTVRVGWHHAFAPPLGACVVGCRRGSWNTSGLACVESFCNHLPVIDHANVSSLAQCRGTAPGHSCKFSCHDGWHPSAELTCVRGAWGVARCQADSCEHLGTAFSELSTRQRERSTCENDVPKPFCERGRWLRTSFGMFAPCSRCLLPPGVDHALDTMHACVDAPSGSACAVRCQDGYAPTKSYISCQDGTWEAVRCNPKACSKPPKIEHTIKDESIPCMNISSGEQCSLDCLEGFFSTDSLQCHLGSFNKPRCLPVGYLGSFRANLRFDFHSNTLRRQRRATEYWRPWEVVNVLAHDRSASIPSVAMKSPDLSLDGVESRLDLHGIYVGRSAGMISFKWRLHSEWGGTTFHFLIDGIEQRSMGFPVSQSTAWRHASFPIAAGLHSCAWIYRKDSNHTDESDSAWIADITIDNAVQVGVYHVPFSSIDVDSQTGARWRTVTDITPYGYSGIVLQSGDLANEEPGDSSQLDAIVRGVDILEPHGTVSFYYKTSSERGFDMLHFYVDGVEQLTSELPASGLQKEWKLVSFKLAAGRHTLTWKYMKDNHGSQGDDVARIADIQIRNAEVAAITLSETLRISHINGDLRRSKSLLQSVASETFGLRDSDVSIVVEPNVAPRRLAAIRSNGREASMYTLYDLTIRVKCTSSCSCENVSATMEHIASSYDVLVDPMRSALGEPSMQVLHVFRGRLIHGNAAPGLFSGDNLQSTRRKGLTNSALASLPLLFSGCICLLLIAGVFLCLAVRPSMLSRMSVSSKCEDTPLLRSDRTVSSWIADGGVSSCDSDE